MQGCRLLVSVQSRDLCLQPVQTFISETGHYYYFIFSCFLFKGEMKKILLDAQELMVKWQAANAPRKQTWFDFQSSLHDGWSEFRPAIFKSSLQTTFVVLEYDMCQNGLGEVAVLRCQDCRNHLCHGCDSRVNDFSPFHDGGAIVNGHIVPIPSTTSQNSKEEWVTVEK